MEKLLSLVSRRSDRFIESNKYFEAWMNWFRRWYMSFLSPVLVVFLIFSYSA